jgi:HAE1 family hydrophobic/amphiphilic exporter-1
MNLPKFSVDRPVTIIMVVTGIMIFGAVSLMLLPQELFPQITYPQLTVVTPYANAAPEEIETLITKPIEEAVGTVAGVKRIHSISKEGLSLVIAEFGWSQNR